MQTVDRSMLKTDGSRNYHWIVKWRRRREPDAELVLKQQKRRRRRRKKQQQQPIKISMLFTAGLTFFFPSEFSFAMLSICDNLSNRRL